MLFELSIFKSSLFPDAYVYLEGETQYRCSLGSLRTNEENVSLKSSNTKGPLGGRQSVGPGRVCFALGTKAEDSGYLQGNWYCDYSHLHSTKDTIVIKNHLTGAREMAQPVKAPATNLMI